MWQVVSSWVWVESPNLKEMKWIIIEEERWGRKTNHSKVNELGDLPVNSGKNIAMT